MYYNRNRKKPVSFTKTHTQKNKYENLTDSELNAKTREFKNTNEHYLGLEAPYKVFLDKYEKLLNNCYKAQSDLNNFSERENAKQ